MKKFILLVVVEVLFFSCSRNNDENVVNNRIGNTTNPILVTQIKYSGIKNGSTEIIYDGDKVKEIRAYDRGDGNATTVFQYEGDLIKSVTMNRENRVPITKTYTYKNDKLVLVKKVAEKDYALGGKIKEVEIHDYTYNNDGTVTVNKITNGIHSSDSKHNYIQKQVLTYTIKNNLITKVVEIDRDATRTTILEYDGKNSPYKNVKGLSHLLVEAYEEFKGFPQNISKYEYRYDSGLGTPSIVSMDEYTYTYNDKGYPIKVTNNRNDYYGVKVSYTVAYTYNK